MSVGDGNGPQAPLLVAGTVRDAARGLRREIARLGRALAASRELHWLIVESDSSDETVAVLRTLADEVPRFRFVTLGRLADRLPSRTERLAFCRNHYLDRLGSDPILADVGLVAVADLDGVNTRLDARALASCRARDDWDMVAANQSGPYYDVWALRHADWSPNDCWAQQRFLHEHGVGWRRARALTAGARMIRLDPAGSWIAVESAFGGFALYRRAALLGGARYDGTDGRGGEVCEHVALNRAIAAAGGRLFINPALINAGLVEHARFLDPVARLVDLPGRIARRLAR